MALQGSDLALQSLVLQLVGNCMLDSKIVSQRLAQEVLACISTAANLGATLVQEEELQEVMLWNIEIIHEHGLVEAEMLELVRPLASLTLYSPYENCRV